MTNMILKKGILSIVIATASLKLISECVSAFDFKPVDHNQ